MSTEQTTATTATATADNAATKTGTETANATQDAAAAVKATETTTKTAETTQQSTKTQETAKAEEKAVPRLLGEKAAETATKTDDAAKATDWKLAAPKDSTLAAGEVDAIAAKAKELGMTQKQAEGFLALRDQQAKGEVVAIEKQWHDAAMAHPEIGGDKMPATVASAQKFMAAHLPEDMRKAIANSPFANHPILLYMASKAGALMQAEDATTSSGGKAAPSRPTTVQEAARAMYPHLYR